MWPIQPIHNEEEVTDEDVRNDQRSYDRCLVRLRLRESPGSAGYSNRGALSRGDDDDDGDLKQNDLA